MDDFLIFFGGTFDPPHIGHREMLIAASKAYPGAEILVTPTFLPPHKQTLYAAAADDRYKMCELAFGDVPGVKIDDYEIKKEGKSYSYLTIGYLKEKYPHKKILFLMGTDMMKSFAEWKNPKEILRLSVPLLAYRKGDGETADFTVADFERAFGIKPPVLPFGGMEVSSIEIKIRLMLSLSVNGLIPDAVAEYIEKNGLYKADDKFAFIRDNLKKERVEHTAGVAEYALGHAGYYGLDKNEVLTAALLHDCAKYKKPEDYPGFVLPQDVPEPVIHQYLGAYIAENVLGVKDEDVLDAIRYHTSGKAEMSNLGKLIFTADMLEKNRHFDGVNDLRKIADDDFERGFVAAIKKSYEFVVRSGKPVYYKTKEAIDYIAVTEDKIMDSKTKAELICNTLVQKKAFDVLKIDVRGKTVLADYFIIASGKSTTQVRSLSEYAMEAVEKEGGEVIRKEGLDDCRWAVVDFGDVILHVFNDETRLFYHLERLWVDGDNAEKIEG